MATATMKKPYAQVNVKNTARPHWGLYLFWYAFFGYFMALAFRAVAEVLAYGGLTRDAWMVSLQSVPYHIEVGVAFAFSYFLGCVLFPGMKYISNLKGFLLPLMVLAMMTICTALVFAIVGVDYGIQGVNNTDLLLSTVFWWKTSATVLAGFFAANVFHKERYFPGWQHCND